MSNIPPTRSSSPAAQRMRRYRKQRRQGLRSVRILLDETDCDALIRMGLLKEDQRQDPKALQKAVLGLLYRAEDPRFQGGQGRAPTSRVKRREIAARLGGVGGREDRAAGKVVSCGAPAGLRVGGGSAGKRCAPVKIETP